MIVFSSVVPFIILYLLKCVNCVIENRSPSSAWEQKLRDDLLSHYNKLLPPDANNSQVALKFMLKSFYFDDNEEIITLDSRIFLFWNDSRLTWNPENYDGITEVLFSRFIIWIPFLDIYSMTGGHSVKFSMEDISTTLCRVMNNGQVISMPSLLYQTTCSSKMRDWPYDTMNCTLKISSRSTPRASLSFDSSNANSMLGAEYGPGWNIINITSGKIPKSAGDLYLNFIFERHGVELAVVILVPSLVLSILTLLCMVLDVNGKIRLGLLCFSLLNHFFYLQKINSFIPRKMTDIPMVLIYLRTSIILTLLAMGITYHLCYLRRKTSPAPNFIAIFNKNITERYGKYLIWPRWNAGGDDCDNDNIEIKEVWTDFASIINFSFMIIMTIVYTSSFYDLIPQQVPDYIVE